MTLWHRYGVRSIHGIRFGLRGFYEESDPSCSPPLELTPDIVAGIHLRGGTFLGSSRGGFDPDKIIDRATYEMPERVSEGVEMVIAGGNVKYQAQ